MKFSTPILFIIFNRPDTTSIVFEEIKKIKPSSLFIAADGPRKNRIGEDEKCRLTREIVSTIDWECDVKTLYREENLGCKEAVSSAINWFFNHVSEGIILEDDCLPHPTFFQFMEDMLERYRNNSKIMMISGFNLAKTWPNESSYFFSKYSAIWGWATWKRAWNKYDGDMSGWRDNATKDAIRKFINNNKQWKIKEWIYEQSYRGRKNSWAYPWEYSCIKEGGLSIVPSTNLIQNIGFDADATHTQNKPGGSHHLSIPLTSINFPLKHPDKIQANESYDNFFIKLAFDNTKMYNKLVGKIKKLSKKCSKWIETYRLSAPIRTLRHTKRFTDRTIQIEGTPFTVIDSASFISAYREIFLGEIYRFKTTSTSPYIIDCGANVGVSVLYFKKHYPNSVIDAFEPDPKIFKVLKRNVEDSKMTNITLHQSAIWNTDGTISFDSDGADGGRLDEASPSTSKVPVKTIRLGAYLNRTVDFLKIDIEGAEDVVMTDIADNLSNVKNLFLEYHSKSNEPQKLDDILRLLKKAGFRYYIKDVGVESHSPFVKVHIKQGFDNQLNIFAYRP